MKGAFLPLISIVLLPTSIANAASTCWDGTTPEGTEVCSPYPAQISEQDSNLALCSVFRDKYLTKQREKQFYITVELHVVPPEYKWVNGEFPGTTMQYVSVPATFKTLTTTETHKPRCIEILEENNGDMKVFVTPEIEREITKRIVVNPERFEQRAVPNLIENGKTRIVVRPSYLRERAISF